MSDELVLSDRVRRIRREDSPAVEELDDEDDAPGGYRAFALIRGQRQHALMLELRFCTGDSLALAYPWLREVRYDRSRGLVLVFEPRIVAVRGRHLEALHAGIIAHRARWVWEADRATAQLLPETEPLVEEITVTPA